MTLPLTPSVQSPRAYDLQNLTAAKLGTRLAAGANATLRGNLRTAAQDAGYRWGIHPAETAAGLTDADLTFGFDVGDIRRYGAAGDGVTDDSDVIQAAVAVINELGGGVLRFEAGKNYLVWTVPSNLMVFTGCTGVLVDGNGCTFTSAQVDGPGNFLITFDDCHKSEVRDVLLQGGSTFLDNIAEGLFNAINGSTQIRLSNLHSKNCGTCIGLGDGSTPPLGGRVTGVVAENIVAEDTYYGFGCSGDGDNCRVKITGINTGRCYFPWNVQNHVAEVHGQQQGPFTDCLLKCYAYDGGFSKLRNLRLHYITSGKSGAAEAANAKDALINLELQMHDTVGVHCEVSNIDITFDVTVNSGNGGLQQLRVFNITKYDENGLSDGTARGHYIENVRVRGVLWNFELAGAAAASLPPINIFDNSSDGSGHQYDWTGDFAHNIDIGPIVINDSSGTTGVAGVFINGQPAVAGKPFVRVHDLDLAGWSFGRTNWSGSIKHHEENIAAASYSPLITYAPTWSGASVNPAIGNGTLNGWYTKRGNEVTATVELVAGSTTTFGTGSWAFTLPSTPITTAKAYGSGKITDAGTAVYPCAVETLADGTAKVQLATHAGSDHVKSTVPHAWASTDSLRFTIRYFEA